MMLMRCMHCDIRTYMCVQVSVVNVLGVGDRLSVNVSKTTAGNMGIDVSLSAPFIGSIYHPLALHVFKVQSSGWSVMTRDEPVQDDIDCTESSHKQQHTGAAVEYTTYSGIGGTHLLRYEAVVCNVLPFTEGVSAFTRDDYTCRITMKQASFAIREQAGYSLKSSVKHTGMFYGHLPFGLRASLKIMNELAGLGLGGGQHLIRNQGEHCTCSMCQHIMCVLQCKRGSSGISAAGRWS